MCSDQEAVDLIRNIQDPQAASKFLVEHALSRFSTDNLSVMIIRFDSKALQSNAASQIGTEIDPAAKEKGAVNETEIIVAEAKRKSGYAADATAGASEDEAKHDIIKEMNEDSEAGPELTSEGLESARKSLSGDTQPAKEEKKEG